MAKTANPKRTKKATAARPKFRPAYIGAWIEHLGRKQVEIADKVGMSESQLSLVINGQRKYIQDKLEAIADELGVERGMLFYPPPGDETDWLSLEGLGEVERSAVRNVVRGFRNRSN